MTARRRGSVSVEAALVFPVLFGLVVGVLEWGRVLASELALVQVVRDAALTGARADASDGPDTAAQARVDAALTAAGFSAGEATISVSALHLACGEALVLEVSVPYDPTVPLVPVPDQLSARTVARLEDQ